ncbi:MAG: hypothetical protein JST13_15080, partial [Bacteroidetes bacterium]|nr:hypothetical protein [Bacteroidota bacterium]
EAASVGLFCFFLLEFLYRLGNNVVILDLIIVSALFSWLFIPVIFYHVYTIENPIARIWLRYMPIPSDDYLSFAVPSTLSMIMGLRMRLGKLSINKNPKSYIENVKHILISKPNTGLPLIGIGLIAGFFSFLSPASLQQVFYLLSHLTFVGFFYILYSPNKYKRIIVAFVLVLLVGQALAEGMFGEMIYMMALMFTLAVFGKKISFYRKLTFTVLGFVLVMIIQSVKSNYREKSWLAGAGADPVYFAQLISEKLSNPSSLLDPNKQFFVAVRFNQGWLAAYTMKMVPERYPFANGETIWQSVLASFVPRFLWPDKPESGGKANLKRFWGYDIKGYSMNIGPSGEAYANFGVMGGIIYMFFYGLFFNFFLT